MNWNAYVSRRNINVKQWLESREVRDRATFINLMSELGLELPDETQLSLMFPSVKTQNIVEVNDGSITVSSERSDQVTTRSVAGEGNGTGQRPDGKRTPKVRN